MPRRSILSAAERESLLALPDTKDELIRHYTFSETDLSIIRQRRGPANRLGFAVQLCYLRFPGVILGVVGFQVYERFMTGRASSAKATAQKKGQ